MKKPSNPINIKRISSSSPKKNTETLARLEQNIEILKTKFAANSKQNHSKPGYENESNSTNQSKQIRIIGTNKHSDDDTEFFGIFDEV